MWPDLGAAWGPGAVRRVAGILLTAIAFTLLASDGTRLVTDVLQDLKIL